ncbi:MAG TPA: hypothetical protein VGQ80_05535 [Acidimicrobiia bacterium]|nr:hypothetical protein [Acidimicrobiia bacterium]
MARRHRPVSPSEVLPRPAPDVLDDGVPATEEVPEELLRTGEIYEGPIPPPLDRPLAADEWGTTGWEEREGEPLDVRLAREEADVPETVDEIARPIYQPGAEYGIDDEPSEVGEMDAIWEDTPSAEELALHIVDEPPGITFDDSPGYLEDE